METLEVMCKHWGLLHALFVLVGEKVGGGELLPVTGDNVHKATHSLGEDWWSRMAPPILPVPRAVLIH